MGGGVAFTLLGLYSKVSHPQGISNIIADALLISGLIASFLGFFVRRLGVGKNEKTFLLNEVSGEDLKNERIKLWILLLLLIGVIIFAITDTF